jgi:hypothetical protein
MLQAELRTSLCNETVGESYAMFALSSSPSHLFLAEAAGDTNIFKDSVVWVTLSAQHGQNFESLEPYDDSGHMEENLFNRASMYGELHITKSCSSDGRRVSLESKFGKFFFANEDEEEDSDSETQILEVVLGYIYIYRDIPSHALVCDIFVHIHIYIYIYIYIHIEVYRRAL